MRKYFILLLVVLCLFSMPVYAESAQVEKLATVNNNSDVNVYVDVVKGSNFRVTLPKHVSIDPRSGSGNYVVSVQGDMNPNQEVVIVCQDTIELTDTSGKSSSVLFDVSNAKTHWNWEDLAGGVVSQSRETVTIKEGETLPAGDFEGVLSFNISCQLSVVDGVLTTDDLDYLGYTGSETSFTIPSSIDYGNGNIKTIRSLAADLFRDNSTLDTIIIEDGITDIGAYTFNDCTSLANVQLPNTLTDIRESAFEGCTSLQSLDLPESLCDIKERAFASSGLTSFELKDGTHPVYTKDYVFEDCTNLTTIDLNRQGEVVLTQYTFKGCTGLTSVELDSNVSFGGATFIDCGNLISAEITCGDGMTNTTAMFKNCCELEEVTFNNLEVIGNDAFCNCVDLETINCTQTLKEIGKYAFAYCESLTELPIQSTLTYIDDYAFAGCSSATGDYVWPTGVNKVREYVFYNCNNITSIEFPGVVIEVQEAAFRNCSANAYVFNDGLDIVATDAFSFSSGYSGYKATVIQLPDSVTSIGDSALKRSAINTFKVPANVTRLEAETFKECALVSVQLHDGITYLGTELFADSNLASVTLPANITSIPYRCFYNCDYITEITIPSQVESIGSEAFVRCNELVNVSMPAGATYPADAFKDSVNITKY